MRRPFYVYSFHMDGKHFISCHATLQSAKRKIESFCECEYHGVQLKADWIGNTTAISAFGDRLFIEERI